MKLIIVRLLLKAALWLYPNSEEEIRRVRSGDKSGENTLHGFAKAIWELRQLEKSLK